MGAPLRLALQKDGSIRFNATGRPVVRVVRELSDMVRLIRENFTPGLMSYTNGIALENPEAFKAEVIVNAEAGKPLIAHDNALLMAHSRIVAEAEANLKAKADALADMEAETPIAEPVRELEPAIA